jgi:hypothetical protein
MLKRLSIWIDESTLARLKRKAKELDRPLGWVIRQELKKAMESNQKGRS